MSPPCYRHVTKKFGVRRTSAKKSGALRVKDKPDVKPKGEGIVKTKPDIKPKVITKPNIEPNEKHKQDVKPNIKSNKELKHDVKMIRTKPDTNKVTYEEEKVPLIFGGRLFRQVIRIPMGTNCAPLLADLFLYSYENEFLDNMIRSGHKRLARSFNLCYRYIDDLIVFNNKKFLDYLKEIYPSQLTVEKANKSDHLADYLDLTFIIDSGGKLSTRLYDKRDDFDFHIVNFPFLSSNIPSGPSYGVYISQLIRYARCCSHYDDFRYRHKCLVDRLLSQGYKALRSLSRNFTADIRISLRNIGGQSMQW